MPVFFETERKAPGFPCTLDLAGGILELPKSRAVDIHGFAQTRKKRCITTLDASSFTIRVVDPDMAEEALRPAHLRAAHFGLFIATDVESLEHCGDEWGGVLVSRAVGYAGSGCFGTYLIDDRAVKSGRCLVTDKVVYLDIELPYGGRGILSFEREDVSRSTLLDFY